MKGNVIIAKNDAVILDGKAAALADADRILNSDRRIVYEVIRIIDGRPVFGHDHYARFENSLAATGDRPLITEEEYNAQIREITELCGIVNNNLKLEQCRVSGEDAEHTLLYPIKSVYPTEEKFRDGVDAGCLSAVRDNPQAKIFNKSVRERADRMIAETGAEEVLLVNEKGEITEGSRSNVFFVKDGTVVSPPQSAALQGITRMKVVELIRENGIGYREEAVRTDGLGDFDAAFFTGTSKDVLPIARIDTAGAYGTPAADCADGRTDGAAEGKHTVYSFDVNDPTLRRLMKLYDEAVRTR